jgi:hypothetical protein
MKYFLKPGPLLAILWTLLIVGTVRAMDFGITQLWLGAEDSGFSVWD